MSPCQHGLHKFGFTRCEQEKDVTGRDQERLWLQSICEGVVVFVLVLVLAATAAAAFVVIIFIVVTSFSFVALQTFTRWVAQSAYRQVSWAFGYPDLLFGEWGSVCFNSKWAQFGITGWLAGEWSAEWKRRKCKIPTHFVFRVNCYHKW